MATAPVTDGRSARSQRTRNAVVDALLDLNREGNLRPTAREIAARAGVSLRSVYVHFDDLEDLFLAAAKRHASWCPGCDRGSGHRSAASRAETLMRMRSRIYEEVGNIRRAAELQAPFSPTLERWLAAGGRAARPRTRLREGARRACCTTLGSAGSPWWSRLSGGPTWDQLRHPLDVPAARKTAVDAIISVLRARGMMSV